MLAHPPPINATLSKCITVDAALDDRMARLRVLVSGELQASIADAVIQVRTPAKLFFRRLPLNVCSGCGAKADWRRGC